MDKMEKKKQPANLWIGILLGGSVGTVAGIGIFNHIILSPALDRADNGVRGLSERIENSIRSADGLVEELSGLNTDVLRHEKQILELEAKRAKEKAGKKSVEPTKSGTVGLMQRQPGVLRKPPVQMHPNNPVKLGRNQLARSMC